MSADHQSAAGDVMRVFTVNLLNGEADPRDLDRALAATNPDVVAAQEIAPNAAVVLEQRFSHGVVKPGTDFRGKALVANFPISVEEVPFTFRPILRGRTTHLDGDLEFLNVHMANPIDGRRGRLPERKGQVRDLLDLIEEPGRRVVAGDFNSSPAWPAYRVINGRVRDVVAEWGRANQTRIPRTWGWRPGWPKMLRIDHVFAEGLHATNVQVIDIAGTDHRAVCVDLELG